MALANLEGLFFLANKNIRNLLCSLTHSLLQPHVSPWCNNRINTFHGGRSATCPPNPDASLNWVVGESFPGFRSSGLSLASVCSWCVDVIFCQCMEGASTLIVLLEKQGHPVQFVTPMAQNSPTELCAVSTISKRVSTCLPTRPVPDVCPTYHCCSS